MASPVRPQLQDWIDDPQHRKIVIILSCAIGLLALWFSADEYFALRSDRAQLVRLVGEAEEQIGRLGELQQRAAQQATLTDSLEQRTVSENQVHDFRNTISNMTRRSGCRVLRMDLAEPVRRPWREGDHPLEIKPASKKAAETPYQLRSQRLSLVLSGPVSSIYEVLGELRKTQKAFHTQSLQLRPADAERQEALLELEILLFDLETVNPATSA